MSDENYVKIARALSLVSGLKERSTFFEKLFNTYYKKSFTGFGYASPLYAFTNESISGYYRKKYFDQKNVLTVCASGDHVLNAILLGAKKIDCFDISAFSFPYFDLKRAAIKALTYDEFISFFFYKKGIFDMSLYSKIYKYLTLDSKIFWDSLYLEFSGKEIRESRLFYREGHCKKTILGCNLYLEPKNYNLLKSMIDNCEVNFICTDLLNLSEKCTERYDFIGLSNIYGRIENKLSKLIYDQQIIKLTNILNENGVAIINYDWRSYVGTANRLIEKLEKLGKAGRLSFKTGNFVEMNENNSVVRYRRIPR